MPSNKILNSEQEGSLPVEFTNWTESDVWTTTTGNQSVRVDHTPPVPSSRFSGIGSKGTPSKAIGNSTIASASGGIGSEFDPIVEGHVNSAPPGGRYLVGKEIGSGGIGIVFSGWDLQLGREVAIKVLRDEYKCRPTIVRRFFQEARITSRLTHQGVVAVHAIGVSPDNRPFYVMKKINGETLDQVLKRRVSVLDDRPSLLNTFLQISEAIAFAHSEGVIHRDLKPANVMVGGFGIVKVIDWGLAKQIGAPEWFPELWKSGVRTHDEGGIFEANREGTDCSLTGSGTILGTPAYLAPEQALGQVELIDQRTDVFGLGGILCEILSGAPPYTGKTAREIFKKAVRADCKDAIARINKNPVSVDLVGLVTRCLLGDREGRPSSASEVVSVMTAHLQAGQRKAEQDLVTFFDLSMDLFCIAGTNGFFYRVNRRFSMLLGYTIEELKARPFLDLVHPDDCESTLKEIEKLSRGEPTVRFVNRYKHAMGHFVPLEWCAQSVPQESAIYAVARDLTDRSFAGNGKAIV